MYIANSTGESSFFCLSEIERQMHEQCAIQYGRCAGIVPRTITSLLSHWFGAAHDYTLQDNSTNGILLNGHKLRKASAIVMDGDVIQIPNSKGR